MFLFFFFSSADCLHPMVPQIKERLGAVVFDFCRRHVDYFAGKWLGEAHLLGFATDLRGAQNPFIEHGHGMAKKVSTFVQNTLAAGLGSLWDVSAHRSILETFADDPEQLVLSDPLLSPAENRCSVPRLIWRRSQEIFRDNPSNANWLLRASMNIAQVRSVLQACKQYQNKTKETRTKTTKTQQKQKQKQKQTNKQKKKNPKLFKNLELLLPNNT